MPILQDIPIALSPERVVEAQQPRRRQRTHPSVELRKAVQEAIVSAQPLYSVAAVYAEFQVKGVAGEHVTLISSNGVEIEHTLKMGRHSNLLEPATRLLAAVYTIGPALEARVKELNQAGEAFAAYWLDTVGVLALGEVGEALRCVAEEKAQQRGWGVSAGLSPGSLVGWVVQGQRELCSLLPLADIGIQLNRHCVLVPHKSASVVIGLGPDYESHKVGSVCHLCSLSGSCWRSK